jgi:hypothetical protein
MVDGHWPIFGPLEDESKMVRQFVGLAQLITFFERKWGRASFLRAWRGDLSGKMVHRIQQTVYTELAVVACMYFSLIRDMNYWITKIQ